jgi:hypothetical protein
MFNNAAIYTFCNWLLRRKKVLERIGVIIKWWLLPTADLMTNRRNSLRKSVLVSRSNSVKGGEKIDTGLPVNRSIIPIK